MKTGGLATAMALAGGAAGLEDAGDEQLALLDDMPSPLAPVERGKSGPKGGRPAGARNRSTEEMRQFFLARHKSPLLVAGEVYSRATADLARELFLTRVVAALAPGQTAISTAYGADGQVTGYLVWDLEKAFNMQMSAVAAAMPYVERKQPIAIDAQGQVAGIILIGDHAGVTDGGDGVLTLDLEADAAPGVDAVQSEQNQQVSEPDGVRLGDCQSHAQPKPQKTFGVFEE